jgi:hypothetical protein
MATVSPFKIFQSLLFQFKYLRTFLASKVTVVVQDWHWWWLDSQELFRSCGRVTKSCWRLQRQWNHHGVIKLEATEAVTVNFQTG